MPAATGANLTLKLVVAPAASDIGVVSPLIEYPVPEIGAWLIVAAAVPVLESVIVCVPLLPTFTLPKLSDVGLAESCGETPVPVAAIVTGEPVALLVTITDPFTAPDTVGANTIESTVVCPAVSVIGVVIPFSLMPVPAAVILEIVTLPVPVFVSVTVFVLLFPVLMLPNATLVGLTLIARRGLRRCYCKRHSHRHRRIRRARRRCHHMPGIISRRQSTRIRANLYCR